MAATDISGLACRETIQSAPESAGEMAGLAVCGASAVLLIMTIETLDWISRPHSLKLLSVE